MRSVRSKNSRPELLVRSLVHKLGYRFRLHDSSLPGCPDVVLPRHRKIIFVHGCFWHQHSCGRRVRPQVNTSYWIPKLRGNVRRAARNEAALRKLGYDVLIVWECQTQNIPALKHRLQEFLHLRGGGTG